VLAVVNFVKLLYLTKFNNAKNNSCEFSRIFRTNVDKSLIILNVINMYKFYTHPKPGD